MRRPAPGVASNTAVFERKRRDLPKESHCRDCGPGIEWRDIGG